MPRKPTCDCGECRKCKHRAYMREWYRQKTPEERRAWVARRDKEKTRAYDRKRNPEPKRREQLNAAAQRWAEKQPLEVRRAHKAVATALRAGRLQRKPCEVCGATEVHAHHDDYRKPLDVRWLCPVHHRAEHSSPG